MPRADAGTPNSRGPAKPFSRDTRLRRQDEFRAVRMQGVNVAGRRCVLVAMPVAEGPAKLTVINSRKLSTRAVPRNRARRLIKEAIRILWPRIRPCWAIVIPRRRILSATTMADVLNELEELCSRAGILDDEVRGTDGRRSV